MAQEISHNNQKISSPEESSSIKGSLRLAGIRDLGQQLVDVFSGVETFDDDEDEWQHQR